MHFADKLPQLFMKTADTFPQFSYKSLAGVRLTF